MLNPEIILAGQKQPANPFETAAQGLQFGQALRQLLSGRQAGKMMQIENPEERKAYANNSMFSRELNAQIRADEQAKQKQLYDQLKTEAEISKISSEASKNNAQAGGYNLDNSGKLMANADRALMIGAQTGDPMAVKLALNNAYKAGGVTPELYDQYSKQIDILGTDPAALKQFASGLVFANAKDPASLMYTSADNRLDNETAMRGQDINQSIADADREYKYDQLGVDTQYKYDALDQNKDQFWADFQQKDAHFYSNQDFQLMKQKLESQAVKGEKPEQKMERVNNALAAADGARQAARASKTAADLINHPGIGMGTGLTSLSGMVPGTDAYEFQSQLENLKAQVFLPTVKAMQGMGALSNAEGEKIAAAVENLKPGISQQEMARRLASLSQQMNTVAQNAKKQAMNYATRGGSISLNTQSQGAPVTGKIYTQAMIREYAQQSGRTVQEITEAVRSSGGTIR